MEGRGGTYAIIADGVVGPSGRPGRVFSITVLSGATGGVIKVYDGTGTDGTLLFQETGTANKSAILGNWEAGLFFPNGVYVDIDANVTSATFSYVAEN